MVSLGALSVYLVFFFLKGVCKFAVCFVYNGCYGFMAEGRVILSSGGLGICRTSLACMRVRVVFLGLVVIGVSVFGLGSMLFAVYLSLVMRLSCLMSDFVMGGCSFVFVSFEGGWVMGQIVWARR